MVWRLWKSGFYAQLYYKCFLFKIPVYFVDNNQALAIFYLNRCVVVWHSHKESTLTTSIPVSEQIFVIGCLEKLIKMYVFLLPSVNFHATEPSWSEMALQIERHLRLFWNSYSNRVHLSSVVCWKIDTSYRIVEPPSFLIFVSVQLLTVCHNQRLWELPSAQAFCLH